MAAETQRRVFAAIEAVGYRPDLIARALSTGSSRTIGVLGHHVSLFGGVSVLEGIEMAATETGWRMSWATVPEFSSSSVRDSIELLISSGCDGVVLLAPWVSDASVLNEIQSPVPVVTTSQVLGYDGPAAYPDAAGSASDAVKHLLGLGHATVWHVAGPEGWNASALRVTGWRRALEESGAVIHDPIAGDWSAKSGYKAGMELARRPGVTAVFAANDDMALGVIYALSEAGIRVPEDVSVVGYDDTVVSEFFRPSLTTIRVDHLDHGRKAVQLVTAQLEGRPMSTPQVVGHELIVRGSSIAMDAHGLQARSGEQLAGRALDH